MYIIEGQKQLERIHINALAYMILRRFFVYAFDFLSMLLLFIDISLTSMPQNFAVKNIIICDLFRRKVVMKKFLFKFTKLFKIGTNQQFSFTKTVQKRE